MKYECEFYNGKDCGKGKCSQYELKQNCIVDATFDEMKNEPGYHKVG